MKKIYLMRHSIPERLKIETSKIPLSAQGVEAARQKRADFNNIDYCFSSPYRRALQTAELIADDVIIKEGLHERIIGDAVDDFWLKQYLDHDYHNLNGESLNDAKKRMKMAIDSIVSQMNEGEESLVVSHATAICSYLLNYCDIAVTDASSKKRRISYKGKVIMDGRLKPTNYFEIIFLNDEVDAIRFCD